MKRIRVRVNGLVQGVFFRASTQEECDALKLVGWVKNKEDGSVELEAEGPEKQLIELLSWLQKGPPNAQVESVFNEWIPPQFNEKSFTIKKGAW